jgi:hypothetical protein
MDVQTRLNQNDVTNQVDVESADQVRDAVVGIFSNRYPGFDPAPLVQSFADVHALFEGRYPGFLPCDTLYHDIRHTLDMTLAMARLVDGHDRSSAPGEQLGPEHAVLGVIIALLHDSGYMKRSSEAHVPNGAVFTKVHVSRSADFIAKYLPTLGLGTAASMASRLVHFTGYEMDVDDIQIADGKDRLLGHMVGTADLIGQISDRMYLEKCREFLYQEFVHGSIARERMPDGREIVRYTSGEDLLFKTPGFYEYVVRVRIEKKLGAADRYAEAHFGDRNLYQAEIERNMDFLTDTLESANLDRIRRYCYSLSMRPRRAA